MSASLDAKSEALENWQKHTIKLFVSFIVRAMCASPSLLCFSGSFSSSNLSRVGISFVRFQLNLMTFFVLSLVLGLMALKMMPMQKHSAMIFTSFLVKNSNCIKEYVVAMVRARMGPTKCWVEKRQICWNNATKRFQTFEKKKRINNMQWKRGIYSLMSIGTSGS